MPDLSLADYLAEEWKPALGCTEPASIAYAASSAAKHLSGEIKRVTLRCDPRIYKNCYAVGIPHSGHKMGIRWALAIGALLPDPSAQLECFEQTDQAILDKAAKLIEDGALKIQVRPECEELFIECKLTNSLGHVAQARIQREHTRLTFLAVDEKIIAEEKLDEGVDHRSMRADLACLGFADLAKMARAASEQDRALLREGMDINLAIAQHGLGLFPKRFVDMDGEDSMTRISRRVCAGVYARMCGEDFVVMSLAGSGNKGITCSVPLALFGKEEGLDPKRVEEALALACLVTSATTHHLGTLSAVCGCSNAAGIGLSAGLVLLEGGDEAAISRAVNNMVGNVTGMICDGAKIGCALKTMTAVDSAFRATSLAMSGIGIPVSDGIVGTDGQESLANMGRMATVGMASADAEILAIMQEKLDRDGS
ncbi:MAG: serine dehydratase subunit alpha family protein [Deltaproteobacteria bacterium]|nr:serine dehydratase subunit alpha family protein [Deltaproteobacteria bacterium]